jgi:hypothetical protein
LGESIKSFVKFKNIKYILIHLLVCSIKIINHNTLGIDEKYEKIKNGKPLSIGHK